MNATRLHLMPKFKRHFSPQPQSGSSSKPISKRVRLDPNATVVKDDQDIHQTEIAQDRGSVGGKGKEIVPSSQLKFDKMVGDMEAELWCGICAAVLYRVSVFVLHRTVCSSDLTPLSTPSRLPFILVATLFAHLVFRCTSK